jgi:arylformamidase
MARKAAALHTRLEVLPVDLSHMAVNRDLGLRSPYTRQVDAFIESVLR